jgi:8-oxo-dGTP pyrophosphatase MutT (NUDIX family)
MPVLNHALQTTLLASSMPENPIRERPTARVLLLDPADRLLLMKGRPPAAPGAPAVWFTIGGGVEPGESVQEAAAREVVEEAGLTDALFGPAVWYSEWLLVDGQGRRIHFKEHFLVARTAGGALSRRGWRPHERESVEAMRWWTMTALARTQETVFPERLAEWLPAVIAGRYPPAPLVIRTLDGPLAPRHGG